MKKDTINRRIEQMLVKNYSRDKIAWFIFLQLGKSWYDAKIIAQQLISEYKEELDA
jgi:hypothetical protein